VNILRWRRTHITPDSVKESFDTLPTGICYCWPNGLPKLVNARMDEVCRALTGEALLDGRAFWARLQAGDVSGSLRGGETPICVLPSGAAISFRRTETELAGRPIWLLETADVTEEYRLTRELAEKEKQAGHLNARLKALMGTMEYVVMERELLELKAALHDNVGRGLLLIRRYLAQPGAVDRQELLSLWRRDLQALKNEEPEAWQTPYFVSLRQASLLGVEVRVEGELPRQEHLLPVVETALATHVTNTLRHAEGSRAVVTVRDEGARYVLTFTNDGRQPDADLQETGGLANLRREAESVGGSMEIRTDARLELILTLPKEADEHGIQRADRG
jgi:hypothetical protein